MTSNEFDMLNATWNLLGERESYWSVITDNKYLAKNITTESKSAFYQSGLDDAVFIENLLHKHGNTMVNKVVLDYGCSVGRITNGALTFKPKRLFGCDISLPHLEVAKKNIPGAEYFHMTENLPDFPESPQIIYSLIVLQHNRPSLMKNYIRKILNILAPDGVAILHIPYNGTHTNLNDTTIGIMEMHSIAKDEVQTIVNECGCTLLEINEDRDMCGGGIQNAVYIIASR